MDTVPERLELARAFGASPLSLAEPAAADSEAQTGAAEPATHTSPAGEEAAPAHASKEGARERVLAAVRAATDGRGADAVLEAVGLQRAVRLAYELVRAGGADAAEACVGWQAHNGLLDARRYILLLCGLPAVVQALAAPLRQAELSDCMYLL